MRTWAVPVVFACTFSCDSVYIVRILIECSTAYNALYMSFGLVSARHHTNIDSCEHQQGTANDEIVQVGTRHLYHPWIRELDKVAIYCIC